MATTYGYARCSTNEARQDIDRQKRELNVNFQKFLNLKTSEP